MRRKIPGTPGMSSTVDTAAHTTRKWSVMWQYYCSVYSSFIADTTSRYESIVSILLKRRI